MHQIEVRAPPPKWNSSYAYPGLATTFRWINPRDVTVDGTTASVSLFLGFLRLTNVGAGLLPEIRRSSGYGTGRHNISKPCSHFLLALNTIVWAMSYNTINELDSHIAWILKTLKSISLSIRLIITFIMFELIIKINPCPCFPLKQEVSASMPIYKNRNIFLNFENVSNFDTKSRFYFFSQKIETLRMEPLIRFRHDWS